MSPARLLEHFGRISEAPDAVPRLRRFILDLAVRGKLVEQDPNDEPAPELLKRIHARRLQGTAETAPGPLSSDPDAPVPLGWSSTALANVVAVINGRAYAKPELLDAGTPVLRVGNLFTSDYWYYSNLALDPAKYCDEGDLLYAWSASFGPFIWRGPRVIFHYHIWKLEPHDPDNINKRYLYYLLAHKTREIKEAGHGVSMLHMTKEKMERVVVPLPPLAEQRRIVDKVDALMALCDQFEAAQTERETRRDHLVAASLARLNEPTSDDGEPFPDHARFHLRHLPRLTTRPEHIGQLRQTVLSLAVRGRLLPQDPADEPAAAHLASADRIRQKTAIQDRRADAERQPLLAADDRWSVPDSWEWRGLADLALFIDYRGQTPKKTSEGVRLITAKNVRRGVINLTPEEFLSEAEYKRWMTRGFPNAGDVLFTTEAPMGYAAAVRLTGRFALAQRVICFRLYGALDPEFLVLQLLSAPFQRILNEAATGLTAKGIKAATLKRLPIAVPPLAEQRRIVVKVEELMMMCHRLETELTTTQAETRRFLEAVLHQVLVPTGG